MARQQSLLMACALMQMKSFSLLRLDELVDIYQATAIA